MKHLFKNPLFYLVLILALLAGMLVVNFVRATSSFSEPTESFPGGNPELPIDISSVSQTKEGQLTVPDLVITPTTETMPLYLNESGICMKENSASGLACKTYWDQINSGDASTAIRLIQLSGYDANDMGTGGVISNYGSVSYWVNAPSGMGYGSIYHLGAYTGTTLSTQFAVDVNHNSANSTKDLWFRTRNNLGWQNDWKSIIHSGNIGLQSVGNADTLDGIDSTQFLRSDQSNKMDTTGPTKLTIEGGGQGYANAALVLQATNDTNTRALGIYMHDAGGGTEWFAGRPYSNSDKYSIFRQSSLASHNDSTAGTYNSNATELLTLGASGNLMIAGSMRVSAGGGGYGTCNSDSVGSIVYSGSYFKGCVTWNVGATPQYEWKDLNN